MPTAFDPRLKQGLWPVRPGSFYVESTVHRIARMAMRPYATEFRIDHSVKIQPSRRL